MKCRDHCGACCIVPSIGISHPALPEGKAVGERCPHLDEVYRCKLFGLSTRPAVCSAFKAEREVCGDNRQQALELITALEFATRP